MDIQRGMDGGRSAGDAGCIEGRMKGVRRDVDGGVPEGEHQGDVGAWD